MSHNPKLVKRLMSLTGKAIHDFSMIRQGDTVMVCISGGKDSWTLLDILNRLKKKAPIDFSIIAMHIDPGFDRQNQLLLERCHRMEIPCHIEKTPIQQIISEKLRPGTSHCSFCAYLRRGYIYEAAKKLEVQKIALGHHREDFNETILLNMFFSGILKSMAPKMRSDDKNHILIRPLVYVSECDTRDFALANFPILDCNCPVCEMPNQQRQKIKALLSQLAKTHPQIPNNIINSLACVNVSHLLDKSLFDFDNF